MNDEIRFIDLFSGIGGFRLGLERANEERRILRRQNMHGHRTDADECLEHGREASSGYIPQEPSCDSKVGLEGSNNPNRDKTLSKNGLPSKGYSTNGQGETRRHYPYFRCVWSCDNERSANQIYLRRFKPKQGEHHTGDIRRVAAKNIPDHDLLCAGFPCQAFSIAGKRKGFGDTRGTLFHEIARIARVKRPPLLLLENVKGLLSHDKGQTFGTILEVLGSIGYRLEWQVLNSKWFGVPQNRERVFIVGHLRNGSPRTIFPITGSDEWINRTIRKEPPISSTLKARYGHKGFDDTYIIDSFNKRNRRGEMNALKTNPRPTSSTVVAVELAYTKANMRQGRFSEVCHDLDGEASKGVVFRPIGPTKPTVRSGGRGSLDRHTWDTLTDGLGIRRLTPVECERLQGFPDGWTEGLSDTQRYKCLGNAVTVNVITFLGALFNNLVCEV